MTKPESVLTGVLCLFWTWRIFAFVYSSYSISDVMTPSASRWAKASFTVVLITSSVLLQLASLTEFPRVSLANRILSVPTQVYSLYFAHKYIGRTLDSRRVTIFLYLMTFFSILETLYMMKIDWNRIE